MHVDLCSTVFVDVVTGCDDVVVVVGDKTIFYLTRVHHMRSRNLSDLYDQTL